MATNSATRKETSWLLLQGVAIVASILLAFSIDAWWQERQEREDVERILEAMLEDFRLTKGRVNYYRKALVAKQNSISQLIEASVVQSTELSEVSIDRLLGDASWYLARSIVNASSLNPLIDSGNLGLIDSERLRRAVALWPPRLEYIRQNLEQDYQYNFNVWMPYLREHGHIAQIQKNVTHFVGYPEEEWPAFPFPPKDTVDHSALLADKRFQNVLVNAWQILSDNQVAYDAADEYLDESIQLLEEELGR